MSDIVKAAREWLSMHDKRDDYWTGDFAEAVIAQAEELAKLRAALTEALDEVQMHSEEYSHVSPRARIAELRRLANGE